MPIRYRFNVLAALKEAGFNTTKLRREKLLAESTIQKLRTNEMVSNTNIEILCRLLDCQPGDIMEYVPDGDNAEGGITGA